MWYTQVMNDAEDTMTKDTTTITGRVKQTVKDRLAQIAKDEGRPEEDVVGDLVVASIEVDDEDEELTRVAIAEADAGGPFASGEEVGRYLKSWGTDKELPAPKATIRF